jgi:hypothetical protein
VPRKKPPPGEKAVKHPVSEKTRAEDERLREMLRNADLKRFDKAIQKAISPKQRS